MSDIKKKMAEHVDKMLKYYKIRVVKWRPTSSGCAMNSLPKRVEIPRPTDVDRFCVCMHEIKHIIDMHDAKKRMVRYVEEFRCDQYASLQARMIGLPQEDIDKWDARTRIHILVQLAKAHNRNLNWKTVPQDIIKFVNWDFSTWEGKKVYIWKDKDGNIQQKVEKRFTVTELNNVLSNHGYNVRYVQEYMPTPYVSKREHHCAFEYDYEGIVDFMLLKEAEVLMEKATDEEMKVIERMREHDKNLNARTRNNFDEYNEVWLAYKAIERKYKDVALKNLIGN